MIGILIAFAVGLVVGIWASRGQVVTGPMLADDLAAVLRMELSEARMILGTIGDYTAPEQRDARIARAVACVERARRELEHRPLTDPPGPRLTAPPRPMRVAEAVEEALDHDHNATQQGGTT